MSAIEVKGWCPGALQPMQSGDGLLVRVRPWCGAFEPAAVRALADIAERLGNGLIDLTRRANLQIRGVREQDVPEMQRVLGEHGLLDRDPAIEAGRNIMVSPLAGLDPAEMDVRAIARQLVDLLAADADLRELPAKFGFLIDGGGAVSIAGERANISAKAVGAEMVLGVNGRGLGAVAASEAAAAMHEAARSFLNVGQFPVLGPLPQAPASASHHPLGDLANGIVGVAAPFGRLEAWQLRDLADVTEGDIRLSPWRSLYFKGRLPDIGLIVNEDDPRLAIDACPGAPACASSTVDTRELASRLAAKGVRGSVHISGCAKGCARSDKADLVLVGQEGRYGVVRNGTARGWVERTVDAEEALNA